MATALATTHHPAAGPAALAEYEAQDRRLHELLEQIRLAEYRHCERALRSQPMTWTAASQIAAANAHLEKALETIGVHS